MTLDDRLIPISRMFSYSRYPLASEESLFILCYRKLRSDGLYRPCSIGKRRANASQLEGFCFPAVFVTWTVIMLFQHTNHWLIKVRYDIC